MSAADAPPPSSSRRAFVLRLARAAAVPPAVLELLSGSARALPGGEERDLSILHAAVALEHQAIALYDEALRAGLFAPGLRAYAVEFRGDHLGHRDTQIAIAEERGGRPPAPLRAYEFGGLGHGAAVVRRALAVELAAQQAYSTLISEIDTRDYLLSAAFILVDEVRHITVWRRVLGLPIY